LPDINKMSEKHLLASILMSKICFLIKRNVYFINVLLFSFQGSFHRFFQRLFTL